MPAGVGFFALPLWWAAVAGACWVWVWVLEYRVSGCCGPLVVKVLVCPRVRMCGVWCGSVKATTYVN